MKRPSAHLRRAARTAAGINRIDLPLSCSLLALTALGIVGQMAPAVVLAQSVNSVLPTGTLPVLRSVVSGQAVVSQSAAGAPRSLLSVNQSSQRAILDWRSFKVSGDSEVRFIQPGATASTLNRIYDANPSVIQGLIRSVGPTVNGKATAGGQVILINQNGIVFDRGAQINTQSLVASTLNLSNSRFLSGALSGGGLVSPAFEGGYDDSGNTLLGSTPAGTIRIAGGSAADPATPRISANVGGSVMLFAPRVDNEGGIITAPDGQVILAAGRKAYLALNEDENNTTLRGYVVEVEAATGGPGVSLTNLVRNAGTISADRGNVTLAALAVNQLGRVSAQTAVQSNGSVYLKARTLSGAGTVTLAQGSVTEVMPDAADKSTMPESGDYTVRRGTIEVSGRTIDSRGTLRAAGGRVVLNASDSADPNGARVYLDSGSETSVAGAWADVPFENNLVTFRVTSNELKNSPDQKNGILRGAEVTVDLRQGSSILDLSGYINSQARTVAEKAARGGELLISSTGSVIQRTGATIDASGGGYRYGAGTANTSRLLGEDGRIYDISTAPQARKYVAQLDSFQRDYARWGQTQTFDSPLGRVGAAEAGYVQGVGGGTVTIKSPSGVVLDGVFKGGVTVGKRQFASAPRGANLTIGTYDTSAPRDEQPGLVGGITFTTQASDSLGSAFDVNSLLSPVQVSGFNLAATAMFGPAVATDLGLVETGFGSVELNSGGQISVPADVHIEGPVGSTLTMRTPFLDVAGNVHLPGGQITLPSASAGALLSIDVPEPQTRVLVRTGGSLATAGSWINTASVDGSYVGTPQPTARLASSGTGLTSGLAGGSVSLTAQSAQFERGSRLDVSGGGSIDRNGRVVGGAGGSLSIASGLTAASTSDWLQADLLGFGISTGGLLSITTPRIVIAPENANGVLAASTTRITPSLFTDFGFSTIRLTAARGIDIVDGTAIRPQQKNLIVDPQRAKLLATGGAIFDAARIGLLPDASRATTNLTLTATDAITGQGAIKLARTAAIVAEPKARIALTASDRLTIDGNIVAPGGDVALSLNAPITGAPALTLGSNARISTAGTFVPSVNDRGLVQGNVVAGGTVTLDARNAGIDLQAGSVIDVSGVRQTIDVAGTGSGAASMTKVIDGPAGAVIVKSQAAIKLDGTLRGRAPSATSAGGSFAMELVSPDVQTSTRPDARHIVVTAATSVIAPQAGVVTAPVAVNGLSEGGFDKLRLLADDVIEFRGDATLAFARGVRLDAPLFDLTGSSAVALKGSALSIGQSLGPILAQSGIYSRQALATSPLLATRAGNASLSLSGDTVDVFGDLTINGVRQSTFNAVHDIRLIGRPSQAVLSTGGAAPVAQSGSLTSAGNFAFSAAQVYPTTRTAFTVAVKDSGTGAAVPNGQMTVAKNGSVPGDVYSAGGQIVIEADTIVQGGRLKAPLGEIQLKAGKLLELQTGSVTSVSSDGLTVPYGTTSAGVSWSYVDGATPANTVTKVTTAGKRVALEGAKVDIQKDAQVDLHGGGDVLGIEFVPGNGGDSDTTLKDNTFAIIPKSRLAGKPFDADIAALKDIGFGVGSSKQDTAIYDSLIVGAGGTVPAGEYALLPARYALLPDAYLVQVQSGTAYSNMTLGETTALPNGNTVLAAFRSTSGTSVRESQSIGVVVRPGSAVRQESDYTVSSSQFFADAATRERVAAPPLPRDAGRMTITRATDLNLMGSVATTPSTSTTGVIGRSAEIDISGPRIAIVDLVGSSIVGGDFLQISSASLSALGGSVLIGGTRADTMAGVRLSTEADTVVVANSEQAPLKLPELMLAAQGTIDIRAGALLSGSGASQGAVPKQLLAEASGALVRLSNAGQTEVRRDAGTTVTEGGQVLIGVGARVSADRAVLVDATGTTRSQGVIRAGAAGGTGGAISLAAAQMSLGEVADVAGVDGGLVLSNADLASYGALDSLTLKGYQGIDFYGSTALGSPALKQLVLDTAALRGQSSATPAAASRSTLQARSIVLRNSNSLTGAAAQAGSGSLALTAESITFGAGDKSVAGWATVQTAATGEIVGTGNGGLSVAADWTLQAQRLRGAAGADQSWRARDPADGSFKTLRVDAADAPGALAADTALGARLTLEGQRVEVNTLVQALSGRVSVSARGTGVDDNVTLGTNGRLIARGAVKDFNGTKAIADAGVVSLTASIESGKVTLAEGSVVDVSAADGGGNAGSLRVSAAALDPVGALLGRAAAAARSGSAELDIGQLASADDFSSLNRTLNQGGFAEARSLRLRDGDIRVASGDTVTARDVTLSTDAGQVFVSGTVGSGSRGRAATIGLYGGAGVTLAAGSLINAAGTTDEADGGLVRVAARSGALNFDAGATIDLRKGKRGETGSVTLTMARDDSNALAAHRLEGTVLSRRSPDDLTAAVVVEGQRSYAVATTVTAAQIEGQRSYAVATTVTAAQMADLAADHQAFIDNTPSASVVGALKGDAGSTAGAVLRGATEVTAVGDLAVGEAWGLTSDAWFAGGRPGTLTLRATGNLTVSNSIGSLDNNIVAGDTWSLRAVAGADLQAADLSQTLALDRVAAGKGDLLLSGASAKLRTGTGRIDLAAARDFTIDNVRGVVYTSGRIGAADTEAGGNNRWGVGGGDITVRAGRDVSGPVSATGDLWITDWFRRPRISQANFAALQPTDWWAYRANFQQGVGTLGGGNIDVTAARDVMSLSAMLPTTGRTYRDSAGARQVDVQGGGDLRVAAGRNLDGGAYMLGRGEGRIDAAGDVGRTRAVQLFMMGASSGDVEARANLDVTAGGALRVQSINNPTIVPQFAVPAATGPSFGTSGLLSSFFTYSDNAMAALRADGGDLSLDSAMARPARTLGTVAITSAQTDSLTAAFPASLTAVSFNGSVVHSETNATPIVTYPSPTARVEILANGSIPLLRLTGSDRDAGTISTPTSVQPAGAGGTLRSLVSPLSGDALIATGPQARLTERTVDTPFIFDIQALTGSITGSNPEGQQSALNLPARSRVRAGLDIVGVDLTLQNLAPSDVSEVRADEGDIRAPRAIEIRGPGRLLLQAGRNVDLGQARVRVGDTFPGGLLATGNNANPNLATGDSARVTVLAGVTGDVDLAKLDASFGKFVEIAGSKSTVFNLFKTLDSDTDRERLKTVGSIEELAALDSRYASFVELGAKYPQLLNVYLFAFNNNTLPLGNSADAVQADALYKLLNASTNVTAITGSKGLADLAKLDASFQPYVALDAKYPRVFAEYKLRLANGVTPVPIGMTSILYADVFNTVIDETIPTSARASGSINSYLTSIQTFGGSDVDLWAPNGSIVVGLTTPSPDTTIGVVTNSGGAIRSVVRDNFSINQGKVLTAQGGDIVILSSAGNVDAGRGAKTSLSTPPPKRSPIFATPDGGGDPIIVGYAYTLPASASGSGIQTLTSDPDGLGPLTAPPSGGSYLITPAGVVDAGEAGIRSDGNVFIDALAVRNASNISFAGTGTGVPVAVTGSLASSLASSGGTTNTSKAAEDAATSAGNAARAAAASAEGLQKPTILTVEVMGFGEKNCKEQQKDCFAK
jgi:filamentous hemagglutinin family protein